MTTPTLRPYQREAVDAVWAYLRKSDRNPAVVLPTGAGKGFLIAELCREAVQTWNGRVLVLAHVRELLEQAADKLRSIAPDLPIGIFSAGLGRRDIGYAVTIAGIQSVYQRGTELGPMDLIIVDECFVEGTLISTPSGPVPIEHIQPGMIVHNAMGIGQVLATSARNAGDLVTLEYDDGTCIRCTANHPVFTSAGWRCAGTLEVGSIAVSQQDLRMLRKCLSSVDQDPAERPTPSHAGETLDQAKVLFDLLLQDPQQLHEVAGRPPESVSLSQSHRTSPVPSGREWETDPSTDQDAAFARRGVDTRTLRARAQLQEQLPSEESEDRHCELDEPHSDRTGRQESSVSDAAPAGRAKNSLLGSKRLVRVTHHERTRRRSVFNLHVSGHPSYFAHDTLVHNCHLIAPDGEGMYRRLLSDIAQISPHRRVVGLTATPYRTKTGMICGPENVLNEICFEVGVRELVVQGYLSPLRSRAGKTVADTDSVHVRGGEFVAGELEDLMSEEALVQSACREIVDATTDRSSVLIFCSGVRHGERVSATITELADLPCGFITGDTPAKERDHLIEQFKRGDLKYLANVNVLTTGFDAPNVDCVVMLRPTMSPGLFCQMAGRGFRLHPGKEDCLVLDFGGNVLRHGPVDAVRIDDDDGPPGEAPAKQCPSCDALIATGYAVCPQCGHVFPPRNKVKHKATASDEAIMSDEETSHRQVMSVSEVSYHVHLKRGDPMALPTMRVEYRCNLNTWVREWICFEHPVGGYARGKAAYWWRKRSNDPIPESVEEAVDLANAGALATPLAITVEQKPGDQWERIVGYQLGDKPPKQDGDDERETNDTPTYVCADDELPF